MHEAAVARAVNACISSYSDAYLGLIREAFKTQTWYILGKVLNLP